MDTGEDTRTDHREDGHRFRGTVYRGSPVLLEQTQNRRDQRSRVTNTDPEHEVGDVPRPVDLVVETPDTDTCDDQIEDHHIGNPCD